MMHVFLSVAWHGYTVAAVVYLAYLVRKWRLLPTLGRIVVTVGLLLHATALVTALWGQWGARWGPAQGLSILSFLLVAIFLTLDLRYRMSVMGAFLLPLAVAILLPSLLLSQQVAAVPTAIKGRLLAVHVSIAILGLAAFAVAAGVAVMYLLMDRQMKAKHFGLLFSRLPSLRFLDELNRLLVLWGFVALSVTLVTGAFFTGATQGVFWQWGFREIATLIAWAIFAGLLAARSIAGWQGRRAAVLTMAGFGILLVTFFSSYDLGQYGAIR